MRKSDKHRWLWVKGLWNFDYYLWYSIFHSCNFPVSFNMFPNNMLTKTTTKRTKAQTLHMGFKALHNFTAACHSYLFAVFTGLWWNWSFLNYSMDFHSSSLTSLFPLHSEYLMMLQSPTQLSFLGFLLELHAYLWSFLCLTQLNVCICLCMLYTL